MAAPNIVNVTTITGKSAVQDIGTSATAIVTNSASSGEVFKVNALYVSNTDSADNGSITIDFYRSSTAYHIATGLIVPANATIDAVSKPIYLEEGDALRLTGGTGSALEAVCSYEEIS